MIKLAVLAAVLNQHSPGAGAFAPYFLEMGIKFKFDPVLISSVSSHESKLDPEEESRTNDHGLMQVHVSKRMLKKYWGKEHLLHQPRRNILVGTRLMRMWKNYHDKNCEPKDHHWLQHYNQGVKPSKKKWHKGYSDRVLKVYHKLKKIERAISDNKKRTVL